MSGTRCQSIKTRAVLWKALCALLIAVNLLLALYRFIFCYKTPTYTPNDGIYTFNLPPVQLSDCRDRLSAERSTTLRFAGYYETDRGTLLVVDVTDVYVLTNRAAAPVTTWVSCEGRDSRFWGPVLLCIDGSASCSRETDGYGNASYSQPVTLQPGESAHIERTWRAKAARELLLSRSLDAPPCTSHTLRMEIPDWLELTDQNLGLTQKTGSVTLSLPTEFEPDAPELSFRFQILQDVKTAALLEAAPPAVP